MNPALTPCFSKDGSLKMGWGDPTYSLLFKLCCVPHYSKWDGGGGDLVVWFFSSFRLVGERNRNKALGTLGGWP